jgi:hypothetical protein
METWSPGCDLRKARLASAAEGGTTMSEQATGTACDLVLPVKPMVDSGEELSDFRDRVTSYTRFRSW